MAFFQYYVRTADVGMKDYAIVLWPSEVGLDLLVVLSHLYDHS